MDEQQQPGAVIGPSAPTGSQAAPSPGPAMQAVPAPHAPPLPPPPAANATTDSAPPVPGTAAVAAPGSPYPSRQDYPQAAEGVIGHSPGAIRWQADEFEASTKSSTWYGAVTLGAILAAIATFFLTGKDFFAAGAVLLAVLGFAYLASRKPDVQTYTIDDEGVHIGNRLRRYEEFRDFSVSETGGTLSLVFTPLKRFAPPTVVHVTPEYEEAAVELLSAYLPMEEHKTDAVDSLLRRIKL